jgi:hypothetical protein
VTPFFHPPLTGGTATIVAIRAAIVRPSIDRPRPIAARVAM